MQLHKYYGSIVIPYCLLGYIKLKMITESNRVLKSRHLKIKSAIVQNPSDICKKTGNCTESIFRIDCNAMLGAFISFFLKMQVTDLLIVHIGKVLNLLR